MSDKELTERKTGRGGVAVMVSPRWRDYVHLLEADIKGRYIIFAVGDWTVIGIYFSRQDLPRADLDEVLDIINKTVASRASSPVLWCGDFNAHNDRLTGGGRTCNRGRLIAERCVGPLQLRAINPRGRPTFHWERTRNGSSPSRSRPSIGWW